jgi:MFS family permease
VTKKGSNASVYSALALSLASFGDAFLYPFLPLNHDMVGLPVIWVGAILSINRFVRILSNSWMVWLYAKFGLRTVMIGAVVSAIISTAGYGISSSIFVWLIFRVLWGLSFSAMRIGTLGYAIKEPRQGLGLGVSRSLQELGPLLTLFLVPGLLENVDTKSIFFVLAGLSLTALWFVWNLPRREDRTPSLPSKSFFRIPSTLNSITFTSAVLIDGIVVVVLGILFLDDRDAITLLGATSLAAFYLAYRRICVVLLSPLGGWLADIVGIDKVFNLSIAFVIIGLFVLIFGWIELGAIIIFTFYSINAAVGPGSAIKNQSHTLAAIAENATWRDIGAAIGTLTGGLLLTSEHLNTLLFLISAVLSIILLIHAATLQRALKFFRIVG